MKQFSKAKQGAIKNKQKINAKKLTPKQVLGVKGMV
jgi:hypothetical protein